MSEHEPGKGHFDESERPGISGAAGDWPAGYDEFLSRIVPKDPQREQPDDRPKSAEQATRTMKDVAEAALRVDAAKEAHGRSLEATPRELLAPEGLRFMMVQVDRMDGGMPPVSHYPWSAEQNLRGPNVVDKTPQAEGSKIVIGSNDGKPYLISLSEETCVAVTPDCIFHYLPLPPEDPAGDREPRVPVAPTSPQRA